MGERYESVTGFESRLREWASGLLLAERLLFSELAELMLEPIDIIAPKWQDKEERAAQLMMLARLFNDFEAAKLLLLDGLPEQAVMPLRDSIECMGLLRLFEAEPNWALKWVTNLSQYGLGTVKAKLKELGVDAPESVFYDVLSQLAHPNLVASVSRVREIQVTEKAILRQYHFGGYRNDNLLIANFHLLLGLQMIALLTVLPMVYYPYLGAEQIAEWFVGVQKMAPKLQAAKVPLEIEEAPPATGPETQEQRALRQAFERKFTQKCELAIKDIVDRE